MPFGARGSRTTLGGKFYGDLEEDWAMKKVLSLAAFAAVLAISTVTLAGPGEEVIAAEKPVTAMFTANNLWMMLCAALVFIMHLGFASIESGLTRAKNTVNILFKNVFIICIGLVTYYVVGFGLMYPGFGEASMDFFGWAGPILLNYDPATSDTPAYNVGYTLYTDFLFQAMFAATAATIVSGAVAERMKLPSFMVFAAIFVAVVYPIAGSWQWGGGWLKTMGFYDFAGSTLVHSVGGWGALIGAWMLGPRLGKYDKKGNVTPIPGSNMPLATIGAFLLWLGWFGFNGGSVLSADPALTSRVLLTTCLAAAAGGLGAMVAYTFVSRKPDLSMALNGILAGLVGITAGADVIEPYWALLIGFLAGLLVVCSVLFLDRKLKIDDPVGAISVHLVCGIWGTLAVGIFTFGKPEFTLPKQLLGIAAYGIFTIVCAFILFFGIKVIMGLRVDAEEEREGLDFGEHDMHSYDIDPNPAAAAGRHAG